jgi:DNA-binding transcriptional MerR regulator
MSVQASATSMSIADAAAASGLTAHTLRYYERDGLMLDAVARAPSGHRRYTENDLAWIRLVGRLRSTGMPIREVRAYAALVRSGDGNEVERLTLLRAHRERVLAQLIEMRVNLDEIERKVRLYERRLAP